jgi:hypothetical protein
MDRLAVDPTRHVRAIREESRRVRRALSADEVLRLI